MHWNSKAPTANKIMGVPTTANELTMWYIHECVTVHDLVEELQAGEIAGLMSGKYHVTMPKTIARGDSCTPTSTGQDGRGSRCRAQAIRCVPRNVSPSGLHAPAIEIFYPVVNPEWLCILVKPHRGEVT